MWTPDFKGFLLPATLFLNHYIPGKPWMHKALICGCNQLSTSATLLLWSQSAFYLSSFTSGIIWHKDFQSGWMHVLGHLCASLLLKGWHTQACCCNRLLHICWSIVLALGWQARWSNFCWFGPQWKRKLIKITLHLSGSKSMHGKEQHLRPDYALQLANLQQFVRPCSDSHRNFS